MLTKKFCISLLLFSSLLLLAGFSPAPTASSFVPERLPVLPTDTLQERALLILQNKCNDCHAQKKKKAVFTTENMNGYAKKINKQVFIKKRMPKGDEVKLTNEERQWLQQWVEAQLTAKS